MYTRRAFTLVETLLMIAALVLFTLTSAAVAKKDYLSAKLLKPMPVAASAIPANQPSAAHSDNAAVDGAHATGAKAVATAPPAQVLAQGKMPPT